MIKRNLHKIDATGKTAGRLATQIAVLLRGKNKPEYEPHIDGGDIVEINNVGKMKFTGKKLDQKQYFRFSGYPGGIKTVKLKNLMATRPAEVLRKAVRNMLPNNRTRDALMKRLIIK